MPGMTSWSCHKLRLTAVKGQSRHPLTLLPPQTMSSCPTRLSSMFLQQPHLLVCLLHAMRHPALPLPSLEIAQGHYNLSRKSPLFLSFLEAVHFRAIVRSYLLHARCPAGRSRAMKSRAPSLATLGTWRSCSTCELEAVCLPHFVA